MATEYTEFKYKIILLGAVGVGKTSIFNRLKNGKFTPNATEQTHGTDIYNCTKTVGSDRIHVSEFICHILPVCCNECSIRRTVTAFLGFPVSTHCSPTAWPSQYSLLVAYAGILINT